MAIACRPATPAPRIRTLAGATVPAAVVIIGKSWPDSRAAISTAMYPPRFAWEDSASIDWARVIRGIASTAKLVTPPEASDFASGAFVSGCRKPIRTWPLLQLRDLVLGRRRDVEHDVRGPGIAADLGAGFLVGVVGVGSGLSGSGVDDDVDPVLGGRAS